VATRARAPVRGLSCRRARRAAMRPVRRSPWRGRSRARGRDLGSSSCPPIYPALLYCVAQSRGDPLPDIDTIRRSLTSLSRTGADGRPLVFLDGPGGSQAPDVVIDAMANYLRHSNANIDGAFVTSQETTELVDATRVAAADFLCCKPEETIFGPNMTTINF